MKDKNYWIETLHLENHPEGGYFHEILRSDVLYNDHPLYTSIYFLLDTLSPSHFHRLSSDEVWYYHAGHPLTIHELHPDGRYTQQHLGSDIEQGQQLQAVVRSGTIFGSTCDTPESYALVGCMVAPGFDFKDFELFSEDTLLDLYPEHAAIIKRLALRTL